MFYLGSDTTSRRIIEDAHRERAQVFASFWARLFGRTPDIRATRAHSATI